MTTILHRLRRKGLVARQLSGRGNACSPAQDQGAHNAQAILVVHRCIGEDTTATTQCSPGSPPGSG